MSPEDEDVTAPTGSAPEAAAPAAAPGDAGGRDEAWERRRRRAAVFGDVLPETTSDERDPDGSGGSRTSEEWLRAQVPPHHGG